jgi:hypothetical protein
MYYICSPYRGTKEETAEYVTYAKMLTRDVLLSGHSAVTPHLYIANCLDDTEPKERKVGLSAALEILTKCDAVVVGQKYGISEGMTSEIAQAENLGIPIFYKDTERRGMHS